MEAGFKKLAIIGVGLIGGSLGLACKQRGLAAHVVGYGRSEERLRLALELGAIDSYQTDFSQGWQDMDLVVLATPVGLIIPILRQIAPYLSAGTIVSDVGSTKGEIVAKAEQILPEGVHFVGAHPIAGTEKSGVEAAFPSLFENANCIITPTRRTNTLALQKVGNLWRKVGSDIILMDVQDHDFSLAAVSHLPHIIAYNLVNTVLELEDNGKPLISLSGGGFRDFTRIAESDPIMWRDICLGNKDNLCLVIDHFQEQLAKMKDLIQKTDGEGLSQEFLKAKTAKTGIKKQAAAKPAIFLDRDGTINEENNYLTQVEKLRIIPYAVEAIKKINDSGLKAVVLTNQSAIARGYMNEETLTLIHHRLKQILAESGAYLDGIYYCPHHPDDNCDCRKPAAGMLLSAAKDLRLDLKRSYMVGDKISDIRMGHNLGLTSVLVLTGYGKSELDNLADEKIQPDYIAEDLNQAVEWILGRI